MFLVGAIMGFAASTSESQDPLRQSILQWLELPSSVLLLIFLPGLVFRDSIEVNHRLFFRALPQLLILAFPMVLVGTLMISVAGMGILDYSFYLASTLGAILSSTDPVAVSSLLKAAYAPPRLQMLIGGESLLNDGSAIVFYTIFSQLYLSSIGLIGEPITLGNGVAIFFRMSLGGLTVGIAFGLGLLFSLYELDRRLEPEYNILQVVVALTFAYLSYFVSEQICQMSGVIACVVTGILVRTFGRGLIHDNRMMDNYLALMEFLLNTLLFTLGGIYWGDVVVSFSQGRDWAFLLAFYLTVSVIRGLQVALFYPVLSRVGLQLNQKEAAFLAFGGMRGAVSVALSLALTKAVREFTSDADLSRPTESVEFFAGGVALLSLLFNGSLAGPVLRYLGLTQPQVSRKHALHLFHKSAEAFVHEEYKKLLEDKRFSRTKFSMVKALVPFAPKQPLDILLPRPEALGRVRVCTEDAEALRRIADSQTCPSIVIVEMRQVFLRLLNEAYSKQLAGGELDERDENGLSIEVLRQSLEFAIDNDEHLQDFDFVSSFPMWDDAKSFLKRHIQATIGSSQKTDGVSYKFQRERVAVLQAIEFINAHDLAEQKLRDYVESFSNESMDGDVVGVGMAIDTVLEESFEQVGVARKFLDKVSPGKVESILSHYVCTILLHRLASFVEQSASDGVLTVKEARGYLDRIDKNIEAARVCSLTRKELSKTKTERTQLDFGA